jgi:hypothetical protein
MLRFSWTPISSSSSLGVRANNSAADQKMGPGEKKILVYFLDTKRIDQPQKHSRTQKVLVHPQKHKRY